MMTRIAMKYKTSATASLHWSGAWGDTLGGKIALRAGGSVSFLGPTSQKTTLYELKQMIPLIYACLTYRTIHPDYGP